MSERCWGLVVLAAAGLIAIPVELVTVGPIVAVPSLVLLGISVWLLARACARERSRFALLFRDSPVALSFSRLDTGLVSYVNGAYERIFGVTAAQIVGRLPSSVGVVFDDDFRTRTFERLRAGGEVVGDQVNVIAPGGPKRLMIWSRAVELDRVRYALTTFLDVTEQARAAEDAREANERFRQLAGSIEEVFWLTDPANTTTFYISPAYERIFGRRCVDLYKNPRDWLAALHPDDVAWMAKESLELAGGPSQHVFRVVVAGRIRSIRISTFPVRDAQDKVIRIAGVATDLTDQLELETQMRQTQKLESLGLLAGGVAHDFNNVLAVIGANAGILSENIPPGDENREVIDDIEGAVTRAASLTRQLLAFSRKQVVEPVVLDLNAVIGDTRKMLRRMVGEDILIETSLEPELASTKIDPGYFVQILMNLAVNARDAMPRGGTFSISTRNIDNDVQIEISDTGCGMPPDVVARVFEPFFTTKEVGKGTGLGLSVVHGIVQQAGGTISILSEVGAGTTIQIKLPIVHEPPEKVSDLASSAVQGSEKIVLVDDDVFVRRSTARSLRSRGYSVFEAGDANAALRLLHDHDHEVALLVTDVVMPGMDGRELVEAARQRRPTLKVLYMSGYTDDAMVRHGLQHDQVPLIEKPFRSHALASKVRHVLDGRA